MRLSRFLTAILFMLVFAAAASAQPAVTVASDRVTASNFPAGAHIVLYGVQMAADGYSSGSTPFSVVLTDDYHDGAVEYVSATPIARRSVWLAADLATAAYAIGTPARYGRSAPERPFVLTQSTGTPSIVPAAEIGFVLYVQPGNGAWSGMTAGVTPIVVTQLTSVSGSSPQGNPQLVAGGLLLIIDALQMTTDVRTITSQMLSEGQ
jgi:hypothetical protein